MEENQFEKLPTNVVAEHYVCEFQIDPCSSCFKGKTTINLKVKEKTNRVVLNCLGLVIKNATIRHCDGCESTEDICYCEADERATILFKNCVPKGGASLTLEYSKKYEDGSVRGVFKSILSTDKGDRTTVITHFEPNAARESFPCFDEPALKATFDIVLRVPDFLTTLSNMDVREEEVNCGCKTVRFNRTPLMSTYTVAFAVGEYDYVESETAKCVKVRVYTPKGKKKQGQYALDIAVKCLNALEKLFDEPYPLPKLDLVPSPNFGAGAMENWGLIIAKDAYLLHNKEESPGYVKNDIAELICHEIAHMWFGNLVTMNWWNHLWLNEGFATFYAQLAKNLISPDFGAWTEFLSNSFYCGMGSDVYPDAVPIVRNAGTTAEVIRMFDPITYKKGASIIRMMRNFMGEEDYVKGIGDYLKCHKYKSVETSDLWRALGEASGKPIAAMMSTWVDQAGYPLLTVSEKHCDDKRIVKITQEVFTRNSEQEAPSTQWIIPLSVLTSKCLCGSTVSTIMDSPSMAVTVCEMKESDWVKLNPGTMDYYRVLYPPEMLAKFVPAIEDLSMPVLDRIGLLHDLHAMTSTGRRPIGDLLKFIQSYKNEKCHFVWESIAVILRNVASIISYTDLKSEFRDYVLNLYCIIRNKISWDASPCDNYSDGKMRTLILSMLVEFEDKEAIKEAKSRFKDHICGKKKMSPDMIFAVCAAVMKDADCNTFQQVIKVKDQMEMNFNKSRILTALGNAQNEEVVQAVLDYGLSDSVDNTDFHFVIFHITSTPRGRILAWKFLKDNQEKLAQRYKGQKRLALIVLLLINKFACGAKANEIEEHFKEHPMPEAAFAISYAVEMIRERAKTVKRDYEGLRQFLRDKC